jgi:chromosome segregation ATPase
VRKLNEDVIALQERTKAAEAAQDAMQQEHVEAMRAMQEATAKGQEASTQLHSAESHAQEAQLASERAQQVWPALASPWAQCQPIRCFIS